MLSNDPANKPLQPQAYQPSGAKAGTAASVPPMKPGDIIEVASSGNGTTNDPSGKDTKPPGIYDDPDLSLLA